MEGMPPTVLSPGLLFPFTSSTPDQLLHGVSGRTLVLPLSVLDSLLSVQSDCLAAVHDDEYTPDLDWGGWCVVNKRVWVDVLVWRYGEQDTYAVE